MKVAFYATMKPPDDPVPSGDRTMARLLVKALETAGHEVELVSHARCRVRTPEHLEEVAAMAAAEVERVSRRWTAQGAPDVVVAYHVYYKSPDLVGAALARRFGLPYVTFEASHAGKRDRDEWARRAGSFHCGHPAGGAQRVLYPSRPGGGGQAGGPTSASP
jgi:hypothetical protein